MEGKMIAYEYRKGLRSLVTIGELQLSAMQSIIRMGTRKVLEERLGKTVYSSALYKKVKRATMPLDNAILMISFDLEANHS
jgi:hypothetical protein